MNLWTHQTVDVDSPRDGSILRIHRLAFWRWARVWGKQIKPPRDLERQIHSAGAEAAYMAAHPEIWPAGEDYSAVYAEHHIMTAEEQKELKDHEANHGSAGD